MIGIIGFAIIIVAFLIIDLAVFILFVIRYITSAMGFEKWFILFLCFFPFLIIVFGVLVVMKI